jgi:hypothetical protein
MSEESDKINAEIGEALAESAKAPQPADKDNEKKGEPPAPTPEDKPPAEEKPETKDEPPPPDEGPDEALVEKAIRLGMTTKMAKSLGDELPAAVELLEKRSPSGNPGGEEKPKDPPAAQDADDSVEIPDLPENADYDPEILKVFKAQKEQIVKLAAEVRTLRSAGESAKEETWIERQFGALGEDYRESLGIGGTPTEAQAKTREAVERRFKVLKAGYKAEGIDIADEDCFKEAVSSVAEARPGKSKKLAERGQMALARPGRDTSTHSRGSEPTDEEKLAADIDARIAAMQHE